MEDFDWNALEDDLDEGCRLAWLAFEIAMAES